MPCRDYRDDHPEIEQVDELRSLVRVQQKRLDELTAHLCYVMNQCEDALPRSPRANDVRDWYKQHRKADIANMLKLLKKFDKSWLENMDKDDFDTLDTTLNDML